jgi:cation diffusion facilitator CzcD-associated flavoprotein CzcO
MTEASTVRALDALIIGAGFSGLHMLWKLRQLGLSARVIESASGVGGTWYHNRYPGARVDIQSLEYSYAFSEELQQEWCWSERYAAQPELLAYANHVADRFGLREAIQLDTRVDSAHFDEATQRWRVTAHTGEAWSARFLIFASGQLSAPNTPAFAGLAAFAGALHHTAQWPHESVDFSGLRVGIVGTSSSAVQAIPVIAKQASALTVFQRTACYAVPAHNAALDPAEEARVKADYARFRAQNRATPGGFGAELPPNPVSALAASPEQREATFEQRWRVGGFAFIGAFNDLLLNLEANAHAAEFVRQKIRSIVRDPDTARLLCPQQPIACKRMCIDSGYYDTFNRPNVRLVDVSTDPIKEISTHALHTAGGAYELDALVLATGFDAVTGALTRIDLRGRGGLRIQDKWSGGPLNYLGLMVSGFPNLFNITGPGSTAAFTNAMVAIEQHVDWIADCIAHLDQHGQRTIEATEDAESAWVARLSAHAERTIFLSCNSWYLGSNIPGKPRVFMPNVSSFARYAEKCADVARSGYTGFTLR